MQHDDGRKETAPLGFGGTAAVGDHIAHLYRGPDQRLAILGPYIEEGLRRGDRCVFISNPLDAEQLCRWLDARGVDAGEASRSGQFIMHPGDSSPEAMRGLVDRIEKESIEAGYAFVRWSGDGAWVLAGHSTVEDMVRWEALYDSCAPGWKMIALCQFDLTQFGGDVIMDVLRSHPICIIGGALVPNPFHVPPQSLLHELSERH